jgi:ABC-type transport system involved in multi-copper enzyme maturation permease subunit
MTRIIQAELFRLLRRRLVLAMAAGVAAFAVVATLAVFASAQTSPGGQSRHRQTTLATLADHGGGTEAFAVGSAFVGLLVFVTFIALIATEFSGGTYRALLLRDPHRLRLIIGKLTGALLITATAVALAELCTFALGLVVAPTKDVSTTQWFTLDSLGAGLHDYATAMAGVAGWAIFGTFLAVVFRSAPLALGFGFAWAGPFENITVESWTTGYRVFPGQVLGSLAEGGTTQLSLGRAAVTAGLYAAVAAVSALVLISHRDVTA